MLLSQVNLRALNTLTAYIAANRDLPVDPSELVDFAHSQYDVEEITYNEARSIIRTYTKNLDEYRSGKVVYSSVDRTRGCSVSDDLSATDKSKKRNHHLRVPTFDMMASTDFAIINEILNGEDLTLDLDDRGDGDKRPSITSLTHSVSTESSTSAATTQSLHSYREPAPTLSRSRSSPDLTSTEEAKQRRKRKKHKKKKKSKRRRRKEREAAAAKEGHVADEQPVGLWDTVCSLFAPPDMICYCSGNTAPKDEGAHSKQ